MAYNIHLVLVHGVTEYGSGGRNNQVKHFFEENFPRFTVSEFDFLDEKTASTPQEGLLYHRAYELLDFVLDQRNHNQWSPHSSSVIFVGHNIGGSLAQQALFTASKISKYHTIATSTAALIILGTPNSVGRDETWAHTVLRLLSISDAARLNISQLMKVLPQDLKDFHAYDSRCVRAHQVISIWESIAMQNSSTLIIDQESSVLDPKNDLNVELVCNHLDLWQFHEGHTGEAVCQIVELIANSMTHTFSSKFYDFLKVLLHLSPAPYQARTDIAMPTLVRWIRSNSVLNYWKTATSDGVLCLHGPPGSAAAVLTSHILSSFMFDGNPNRPIIIGFSFDRYYTDSRSALPLFTSLVYQILLARPWLFHQISKLGEEMMVLKLFTQETFWVVLNRLLRALSGSSVICIIESAHECGGSFNKIFQDLQQLVLLSQGSLKVVLTFNDPYVIHFEDETFYDILLDSDIEAIIAKSVIQLKANDLIKDRPSWITMEREIIEELCNASTSYTIANLNIDLLRRANIRTTKVATKEVLQKLPSTLEMYYELKINSLMALKDTWILSALKWITFAVRPLTEIELAVAVAFEESRRDQSLTETQLGDRISSDIIQDLNRSIGSFFKVVDTNIQFVHSGFRSSLAQNFGSSGSAEMLVSCIDYIQLFVRQISLQEGSPPDIMSKIELSLFSYAIDSWPEYYTQSESHDHIVEHLVQFLDHLNASDISILSNTYCRINPVHYQMESLTSPLNIACRFGISHYVKRIIHNESSQYGTESLLAGLDIAAHFGHEHVTNLLIQHGVVSELALRLGVQSGNINVVKKLLSIENNINKTDARSNTSLHYAAARGSLDMSLLLLESGADKNVKRADGSIAIHLAATAGHLAIVKLLFDTEAHVTNAGYDSLQLASQCGHSDVVEYLLAQSMDVNRTTADGNTALHLSVEFHHPVTSQMLIDRNAKVNVENAEGLTPLHLAAREGSEEIMQRLLNVEGDTSEDIGLERSCTENKAYFIDGSHKMSPLQLASRVGHINIVELLLLQTAHLPEDTSVALYYAATGGHIRVVKRLLKTEVKEVTKDKDGNTALHMAVERGHLEVIMLLLEQECFQVDTGNENKWTPLHYAARIGRPKIIEQLLALGANSLKKTADGATPLHIAAKEGHLRVFQILMSAGKDALQMKDELGFFPFMLAVQNGHLSVVQELMQSCSFKTNDLSPLHIAATQDNCEMIELLLRYSQNWTVNDQDQDRQTPLHIATKKSFLKVVKLLLEKRANIDVGNDIGDTPLSIAVRYGHIEIMTVLIQHGADINATNNKNETPIYIAAYAGNPEVVRALLSRSPLPDLAIGSDSGWTALHAAFDNLEITRMLLEKDATENLPKSNNNNTPLHLAASNNEYGVFCLLLETDWGKSLSTESLSAAFRFAAYGGALDIMKDLLRKDIDINAVDEFDETALHFAVYSQRIEIVQFLLQEGADVQKVSKMYGTPLLLAAQFNEGSAEIVNLLITHGSDVNTVRDGEYYTALQAAAAYGNCDTIDLLIQNNARVNEVGGKYGTALAAAVYSKTETAVAKLLGAGADPNIGNEDATALQRAASEAMISTVELLLRKGAKVNDIKHLFGSALHAAIGSGSLECVDILLQNDANIDLRVPNYPLPVQYAVLKSHEHIFRALLGRNADITAKDQDGHSILMYGLLSNQANIMNALLTNESVIRSINNKDDSGDTALLIATKRSSGFVEDLLKNGADPNSQDSEGKTPLIHAASMETQSTEIISLLLEHAADPTIKDCRLRGPLYWVSLDGYTTDFNTILEAIKDKCDMVDYIPHCESAISAAVAGDDPDILSELLNDESLNPNATREDGWTPLYTAEIYGLSSIKSQLLHANSDKPESKILPINLPSQLHKQDKWPCLQIEDDGKTVTITRGPKSIGKLSVGLVRADNPMPGRGVYYFEATILEGAKTKLIGIGFCKEQAKLNQMLGWGSGSWGYHGDDGNSFKEGLQAEYGEQYDTGDVIGCGVDFDRETAFYTKNGVFIGDAFSGIRGKLYPAVSFRANGEEGIGASVSVKFWDNRADFCYKDSRVNLDNLDSTGTWNPA
ncbi:hypothetical protein EAE99_008573 [Botrytis elliptica]|nr:hypothetical protein EAE99_008573 [Botrytis elliptica]